MCLIPITSPVLTFNDLLYNNYCTRAFQPGPPLDHSEPKALPEWDTLWGRKQANTTHVSLQYDIFLYTYLSPYNDCANRIVREVTGKRLTNGVVYKNLGAFYIAYTQPYDYDGKSTLKATQGIFNKHNNNPKDPGGNPTKKIILFDKF